MGAMTSVMVGLGVAQAGTQIIGGFMQKDEAYRNARAIQAEADYNAGVFKEQAKMIEHAKNLKTAQDNRMIRFAAGKHIAMTAGKGLEMSGSPIAVLEDTMTQMEMDKAIMQYNYDMQKYGVESQAEATRARGYTLASQYRSRGDTAMFAGLIGGMTTIAKTGYGVHLRYMDTSGGIKRGKGA